MDYAKELRAFEEKHASLVAANAELIAKAHEKGESLDEEAQQAFDDNKAEMKGCLKHIENLREMQEFSADSAKPVEGHNAKAASETRGGIRAEVKTQPKLDAGIEFARLAQVRAVARLDGDRPQDVAKGMFGESSNVFGFVSKGTVAAGTTVSGNWAADLVSTEGGIAADFVSYLRPATILGKFGMGNIPPLRSIPHNRRIVEQTGGGAGYWVGEAKPKPLTAFDFNGTTLDLLKVANIAVISEELVRDSSPEASAIVRDSLRDALAARLDTDFVDPTKTASSGVSPASITNAADAIVATSYNDADDIDLDIRSLIAKFTAANNSTIGAVFIMSETNAVALSMLKNTLGGKEYPEMQMDGGTLWGKPVIVSEYVGTNVIMVKASDIYLVDNGGVTVDMSREASLEMLDASLQQNAPTGASLVSMFQNNLVAIRAERAINWAARRASSVAYLTGVAWGGAVNAS